MQTPVARIGTIRFIALALLVAAVVAVGGAAKSSAHGPPAGAPDTYVAGWDAVGARLSPRRRCRPPRVM